MKHVCVIGAGIVGSASALALARAGFRVTVVDALASPGQGVSLGNGAQLSYSYVEPLATPAALRALPVWLTRRDSPLAWRPRMEAHHWRWLLEFIRACTTAQVQRTTEAMLALAHLSRDTLADWQGELQGDRRRATSATSAAASAATSAPAPDDAARGGVDAWAAVNYRQAGKLVVYRDDAKRAGVQRQLDWQAGFGSVQELLDADACRRAEPALAHDGAPIAFGVWAPGDAVADAAQLSASLLRASGAELRFNTRVTGMVKGGAGRRERGEWIAALATDQGDIEADHFVVAGGAGAAAIMARLGVRLPIEPIKGYSVTLRVRDAARAPSVSITDTSRKLVYARLGESIRVAGFAELRGASATIEDHRIAAILEAVEATFPGACDTADPAPWTGLRPATPSSRPLIGATPLKNLWVNAGHGALGLTLACGSAALLVQQMRKLAPQIDHRPFCLSP